YCTKGNCYLVKGPQHLFFGPVPENVVRKCIDSKMYAMTFDDGPTANWDELLEVLSTYHVKATFFVNGRNLDDPTNRARVLKAHQLGHQISNHSTHHLDFFKLLKQDKDKIPEELEGTRKKIIDILGSTPRAEAEARIMRPPFGYADKDLVKIFD